MKKHIIGLIACSCFLAGSVHAATVDSVSVSDFENSILTVSGTVDDDEKGVNILVIKQGQEIGVGDWLGNTTSLQNTVIKGSGYTSTFKFEGEDGIYNVYASNCKKPYQFEYISKTKVLEFVTNLGDGKVAENEIFNKLEKYAPSLGIDITFADTVDKQSYLVGNIIYYSERIKANKIDGVESVTALTKAELEFMSNLKSSAAASSVNTLITQYAVSAEIDLTGYNNLTDSNKLYVCTGFVKGSYTDMKVFREALKTAVTTAAGSGTVGGGGSSGGGSYGGGSSSSSLGVGGQLAGLVVRDEVSDANGTRLFEIYSDVRDIDWAWDAILYVSDNGIMNGIGENEFQPNGTLTREQFAKIITIAFNIYNKESTSTFSDVSDEHWAAAYIASANNAGIMTGIEDGVFGIGMPITREDMCVTIYRAAQKYGMIFTADNKNFNDFELVSDYAAEAVSKMAGSNIINGFDNGIFAPKQTATRAQAAKIIYLIFNK